MKERKKPNRWQESRITCLRVMVKVNLQTVVRFFTNILCQGFVFFFLFGVFRKAGGFLEKGSFWNVKSGRRVLVLWFFGLGPLVAVPMRCHKGTCSDSPWDHCEFETSILLKKMNYVLYKRNLVINERKLCLVAWVRSPHLVIDTVTRWV